MKHGAKVPVWRCKVLLEGDLSHMLKGKPKAWTMSAENSLDPVKNGVNTKGVFGKKDVADTSCTVLQTVDSPFIHHHDMKFLYHSAASA